MEDQNIEQSNSTPKLVIATLVAVLLGGGGGYTLNQTEINLLKDNVEKMSTEKRVVLKDYIYDKIRLNEIPNIDLSYTSPEEITQAYIDNLNEKGIEAQAGDDALELLKVEAESKGELCR